MLVRLEYQLTSLAPGVIHMEGKINWYLYLTPT